MKKEYARPEFSEYDFLELYAATIVNKRHGSVINKTQLQEDLLKIYSDDYSFLFEDICKKESIEYSYFDLTRSFHLALISGLLTLINDTSRDVRYIINLSPNEAMQILSQYSKVQSEAMSHICNKVFELKKVRETDEFMKETGIVGRTDDLGIVVIPKEIRNNLIDDQPAVKKLTRKDNNLN